MSRFTHTMLLGGAIVGAFFGGYLLNLKAKNAKDIAAPVAVANSQVEPAVDLGPTPLNSSIVLITQVEPPPMPEPAMLVANSRPSRPELPPTPTIDFKALPPADPNEINPFDPAFQFIKQQIGIKTTILGDPEPVPSILLEAKKDDVAPPGMNPTPLTSPPKLDIPPRVVAAKLVNKRDLLLDFEMTRIGSSKIAAVELWTTHNGGVTWLCTDKVAGCQSPFKTRLGSAGEYGFRLVFESESGMRTAEPTAGTSPDMSVELDVTAPKVSQIDVEPAGPPGKIWVNWQMSDAHLDPNGTQLEYSVDGCEWREIEVPTLTHTGDHYFQDWTIPADVPAHVLIRITARDLAGNVTTVQTPTKVLVDLVAPEGKITGVSIEGNEAEVGPTPRSVETDVPDRPQARTGLLQFLLPRLLNSPALLVTILQVGQRWDVVPDSKVVEQPPFIVRDWIAGVCDSAVVREQEQVVAPYVRRDFFEPPVTFHEAMPEELGRLIETALGLDMRWPCIGTISTLSESEDEWLQYRVEAMHWYRDRIRLARLTQAFNGGRSLIFILADPNWQPTNATPESYSWEYTTVTSLRYLFSLPFAAL